jgi:Spy/CpxP family protein refolding chaperone
MIGKMKIRINRIVVVALLMFPITAVMAQQRVNGSKGDVQRDQFQKRDGSGMAMAIPDLTEEQQGKIKELHMDLMKESLPIRNQIGENSAKMRTLETAETPDMKVIEKLIDESAKLEASLEKKRAANHQEIRKLLTDEQRVIFDSRSGQMGARANRSGADAQRGMQKRQRIHQDDGNN